MREILFRGKRTDNGNWIEGHLFARTNDCFIIPLPIITSKSLVNRETVGQFTGLTDKNGKKIFEGDIVRYMSKETMVVVWNKDSASFAIAYSAINFNYLATISSAHIYLEVIGNIHDNPELLENP